MGVLINRLYNKNVCVFVILVTVCHIALIKARENNEAIYLAELDFDQIPVLSLNNVLTLNLDLNIPENITDSAIEGLSNAAPLIDEILKSKFLSYSDNTTIRHKLGLEVKKLTETLANHINALAGLDADFAPLRQNCQATENADLTVPFKNQEDNMAYMVNIIVALTERLKLIDTEFPEETNGKWAATNSFTESLLLDTLHSLNLAITQSNAIIQRYKRLRARMEDLMNMELPGAILTAIKTADFLKHKRPFQAILKHTVRCPTFLRFQIEAVQRSRSTYHKIVPIPYIINDNTYAVDLGHLAIDKNKLTFIQVNECLPEDGFLACNEFNITTHVCLTSVFHAQGLVNRCPTKRLQREKDTYIKHTLRGTLIAALNPEVDVMTQVGGKIFTEFPLLAQQRENLIVTSSEVEVIKPRKIYDTTRVIFSSLNETTLPLVFTTSDSEKIKGIIDDYWQSILAITSVSTQIASLIFVCARCSWKGKRNLVFVRNSNRANPPANPSQEQRARTARRPPLTLNISPPNEMIRNVYS